MIRREDFPAEECRAFREKVESITHLRQNESSLHCCRDRGEYEYSSQLIFRSLVLDDLVPLLLKLPADFLKLVVGAATAIADVRYDTVCSLLY